MVCLVWLLLCCGAISGQEYRRAQLTCLVPTDESDAIHGRPGKRGPTGPAGLKGSVGSPGGKGSMGPAGPKGSIGSRGPKGSVGPVGSKGEPADEEGIQTQLRAMASRLEAIEATLSKLQTVLPANCRDIPRTVGNGVHLIHPFPNDSSETIEVYCDQTTGDGGWMVIQRRVDNSVNFAANWSSYQQGFGNLNGNYWMGLETLHRLTHASNYELRVDLTDADDAQAYVAYKTFSIGSAQTNYSLSVGRLSGTTGDSLAYHNGKPFSTYDRDNGNYQYNCPVVHGGGWWYGNGPHCHQSNLNGVYLAPATLDWKGLTWNGFRGQGYSLKQVEMKVRRL